MGEQGGGRRESVRVEEGQRREGHYDTVNSTIPG